MGLACCVAAVVPVASAALMCQRGGNGMAGRDVRGRTCHMRRGLLRMHGRCREVVPAQGVGWTAAAHVIRNFPILTIVARFAAALGSLTAGRKL